VGKRTQCKRYSYNKFPVYDVAKSCSELGSKYFADEEEVEKELRKCLRHRSIDFYGADFYALVKRWDKCIDVGGGYVEKENVFFLGSNITYFTFYICDLFTDSSS
jgi:hypothetical protein